MIKTAKIVGLNTDQQAAQALVFSPNPETTYILVASIVNQEAFPQIRQALATATAEAEAAIDDLQTQPLADQAQNLLHSLEQVLPQSPDTNILVSIVHQQTLYLLRNSSSVAVYLWRKNRSTQLSNLASEKKLISGRLQEGDRLVFTTTTLISVLADHPEKLYSWPLEDIEDEMNVLLPEVKVDPIATIVLDFGENLHAQRPTIIPESPVQEDPALPSRFKHYLHLLDWHKFKKFRPRTKQQLVYTFTAFVGVVGLLYGGYVLHHKATIQNQQFQASYQKALTEYNQAQALKDSDTVNAKQNLIAAKADLATALKVEPKQKDGLALQKQINDNTAAILKSVQVTNFPLWLDLNLIKQNFTTQNLSLSVGNLLVLDNNQKSLVAIDLTKKSNQILTGGDKLGDAQFASLNGTSAFAYTNDRGMVKIDLPTDDNLKDPSVVVPKDNNWGHISDIYAFGGNLYLADEFKNTIWKYIPLAAGYAPAQNYLGDNVKVDLAGTRKMEIDGSVWILKNDGELLKFTQGYQDYFSYAGLDQPVSNPKSFFVSSDTQNLYLLDSGNNRLLVLDKKGNYLNQYQGDLFGQADDLAVDEQARKIYLLSGSKIYQIPL